MTEKMLEKNKKYSCDICHFSTSNKYNYEKHLGTPKHKKMQEIQQKCGASDEKMLKNASTYCSKIYKSRNGLWLHRKKCTFYKDSTNTFVNSEKEDKIDNNIILKLIQQNQELQNTIIEQNALVMEQNKKLLEFASKSSTTINGNNNCNNRFNLNVFLNEISN